MYNLVFLDASEAAKEKTRLYIPPVFTTPCVTHYSSETPQIIRLFTPNVSSIALIEGRGVCSFRRFICVPTTQMRRKEHTGAAECIIIIYNIIYNGIKELCICNFSVYTKTIIFKNHKKSLKQVFKKF